MSDDTARLRAAAETVIINTPITGESVRACLVGLAAETLARGVLALLDRLAAAESLTRERQAEIIRHCDGLADKVFGAADDGEPVTEEWLRALNAEQIDSLARHWVIARVGNRFEVYYFPKDNTLRLHVNNLDADGITTSYGGCHVVTVNPTRGHVRRLAAALTPEVPHA